MGVLSFTTFCWEQARAFTLSVFLPEAHVHVVLPGTQRVLLEGVTVIILTIAENVLGDTAVSFYWQGVSIFFLNSLPNIFFSYIWVV